MDHMNKGGSYVIGADGESKLVERGETEARVNSSAHTVAHVIVPEHEAELAKAKAKADKKTESKATPVGGDAIASK